MPFNKTKYDKQYTQDVAAFQMLLGCVVSWEFCSSFKGQIYGELVASATLMTHPVSWHPRAHPTREMCSRMLCRKLAMVVVKNRGDYARTMRWWCSRRPRWDYADDFPLSSRGTGAPPQPLLEPSLADVTKVPALSSYV